MALSDSSDLCLRKLGSSKETPQQEQEQVQLYRGEQGIKKNNNKLLMWLKAKHSIMCLPKPSSLCRSRALNPLPSTQANPIAARENKDFTMWLRGRGETEACSTLKIGMSLHGRGLFATRPIQAGECILRISIHSIITPDKLQDEVKCLLDKNTSNCARLALIVLAEQYAGQASEWAPYMNCLPRLGSLHNTVLWSDEELEMVRQSNNAYHQSLQFKTNILEEFAALQHVILECPHIFGSNITATSFCHAYSVVNSRAWGLDDGRTIALVPFVDFLNHDVNCESFLSFDKEYNHAEVIADRDYVAGEQVVINYGKFGNSTLSVTFGFTLEHNPYDQVAVSMNLSARDPLYKKKLELLQSHAVPYLSKWGDDCGVLLSHTLPNPFTKGDNDSGGNNTFVIKEVKSIKGRGKGIPQSMRAFARVFCASSDQDLENMAREALEMDGRLARRPLNDPQKELEAMSFLLVRLESLIQDYTCAITALVMANNCRVSRKHASCRRMMAEDVLHGELRVLRSAHTWLKHHCRYLSDLVR